MIRQIALLTLLIGATALGLAIIPGLVHDEPLPWQRSNRALADDPETPKGGFTVTVKGVDITFAGRRPTTAPAAPTISPTKPYTIAAAGLAIGGFVTGALSWRARRTRPLAAIGMLLCIAALSWHYIALGVAAGAALVILIIFFSIFGSAFG